MFRFETGAHNALVFEGLKLLNVSNPYQLFQNNSTKTLILRNNQAYGCSRTYRNRPGAGTLFIEDIACLPATPEYGMQVEVPHFAFTQQKVFARSINPENTNPGHVNDGGTLWVLGYKFEGHGVTFLTTNGGFTEVLGGMDNGTFNVAYRETVVNNNSHVSLISRERAQSSTKTKDVVVTEIRPPATREFEFGELPLVALDSPTTGGNAFAPSSVIPLYVGYNSALVPKKPIVHAINAGGNAYLGKNGVEYQADTYVTGGTIRTLASNSITGTDDDTLYASERYGNFSYALPVHDGVYSVTLQFAETYWSAAGKRVFDVLAEGQEVVSDLDIFAQVGRNAAHNLTRTVSVTDGVLNLNFRSQVDNAQLCGLVVRPSSRTINSVTDPLNNWNVIHSRSANWAFATSTPANFEGDASRARRTTTAGTQELVYNFSSISHFGVKLYYNYTLDATLTFYTSADGTTWMPLSPAVTNPIATTGNWYRVTYSSASPLPYGTNYLKIVVSGGSDFWDPQLSEVNISYLSEGTSGRMAAEPGRMNTETKDASVLYPNPASQALHLSLNTQATEPVTLVIQNSLGQEVYRTDKQVQSGQTVTLPVHSLPNGLYLLTIHRQEGVITRRVVIQK
jgi:hypothetical protein